MIGRLRLISSSFSATPMEYSAGLSRYTGCDTFVKYEELGTLPFHSTKARRLVPFLESVKLNGYQKVVTYGPLWSNQVHLVSELCSENKLECSVILLRFEWSDRKGFVDLRPLELELEEILLQIGSRVSWVSIPSLDQSSILIAKELRRQLKQSRGVFVIPYGFQAPETAQFRALAEEIRGQVRNLELRGPIAVPQGTGQTARYLESVLSASDIPIMGVPFIGERPSSNVLYSAQSNQDFGLPHELTMEELEFAEANFKDFPIDLFYHLKALRALENIGQIAKLSDLTFLKTGPPGKATQILLRRFRDGELTNGC